ncbi:hypothetical protein LMG28690_06044 [Paraburkholderia caffeinilytica]|nr:hypothetical protein LMG28690_06044 [Paraburkholderia caffeinilytica]
MMVQTDMRRVPKCSACEAQFVLARNEIVFVTHGQKGALFKLEVL